MSTICRTKCFRIRELDWRPAGTQIWAETPAGNFTITDGKEKCYLRGPRAGSGGIADLSFGDEHEGFPDEATAKRYAQELFEKLMRQGLVEAGGGEAS